MGLHTSAASTVTGNITVDALGLSHRLPEQTPAARLLEPIDRYAVLAKRARDSHKGCYGHVLVVGGDYGMAGAVRMAGEAAARVGAGLVTVATRPEHISIVNTGRPELMCCSVTHPDDLLPMLMRATVLVVGPGLGTSDWARSLFEIVLHSNLPMVVDADALNLLSQAPVQRDHWILTPHVGEASRLLNLTCAEIQDDRLAAIQQLQEKYHGTIVLKGSGTLIQAADGIIRICAAGNPGMASGGMGDVLSGVMGGLLAQQCSCAMAAEKGVLIHSMAADQAAESEGERGLLATDLFPYLRTLVNA